MATALRGRGYSVLEAADGVEAPFRLADLVRTVEGILNRPPD